MAIISLGTYPTVGVTAAERAYAAVSYGLLTAVPLVSVINYMTGNPIIVNSSTGAIATDIYSIKVILWEQDQATNQDIMANDSLLITDNNGMRITGKQAKGTGDGLELFFEYPLPVNGITVSILDGGVLYIYV